MQQSAIKEAQIKSLNRAANLFEDSVVQRFFYLPFALARIESNMSALPYHAVFIESKSHPEVQLPLSQYCPKY